MQNQEKTTLAQVEIGAEAKVLSVDGDSVISRRLMEMGVVPGVLVKVIKTAPFGSPLEIRVKGYHLALRKGEAEIIEVAL